MKKRISKHGHIAYPGRRRPRQVSVDGWTEMFQIPTNVLPHRVSWCLSPRGDKDWLGT